MRFGRSFLLAFGAVAIVAATPAPAGDVAREACFAPEASDPIAGCTALLDRDPDDLAARVTRGDARFAAGDEVGAAADYEAVVARPALRATGWHLRARALWGLGREAEARAAFDRAVALAPKDPVVRVDRAEFAWARHDLDAAAADFAAAITLAPDDRDLRLRRLTFSTATGGVPQRIEDIEALLRLGGEPMDWLPTLSALHLAVKDPQAALAVADRLVAARPDRARSHEVRGEVLHHQGRYGEALASFRESLRLDPTNPELVRRLPIAEALAAGWRPRGPRRSAEVADVVRSRIGEAQALIAMNHPDDAIAVLDATLRLDPRAGAALALRGELHGERGDTARAIRDLELALRLEPTRAEVRADLGRARLRAGDLGGAEDDLDAAITALPAADGPRADRARARAAHGDLAGARDDAEVARRLAPQAVEHRRLAGRLAFAAGDFGQARDLFAELAATPRPASDDVVWLYLCEARLGGAARPATAGLEAVAVADRDGWIGRIAAFHLGRITAADLVGSAGARPAETCEARLHIAEARLVGGDEAAARAGLADAMARCGAADPLTPVVVGETRRLGAAGK